MTMSMTADEILEHVRALSPDERRQFVERVVHEDADERKEAMKLTDKAPLWADLTDEEFDAFQEGLRRARRELPMRAVPWERCSTPTS